ncbi:hypothetical protein [Luteolibacter soli]|uniref:Uncharacterized protein n=1 Tax=Luteolibacter soli TaxID=3135280 RepID=A0ABU9AQC9_9BACT
MWIERCSCCDYEGGGTISLPISETPYFDLDKVVSGYFQLSELAQVAELRRILPELQSQPSAKVIEQLRSDGLRWHMERIENGKAVGYTREAREHGINFIIVA